MVRQSWFNNLNALARLGLAENKIEDIDDDAIENLVNLEELYLHDNKISEIKIIWFTNMINLRRLDLYHNPLPNIESIDKQLFEDLGLEFLEKLNIV